MYALKSAKPAFATFLLITAGLFVSARGTAAQSISWTGSGDGSSWSDPQNWSPVRLPEAADDVAITQAGTYAVLLSANTTVNSLTLGGSSGTQSLGKFNTASLTLTAGGSVLANGLLEWSSGTLTTGSDLTIEGEAVFSGASTKVLSGTFVNTGVVRFDGSGMYMGTNSDFDNRAAVELAGDVDILRTGGAPYVFRNSAGATVTKTSGVGNSVIDVPFENTGGAVSSEAGVLLFGEGGTYVDGTYDAAAGAEIQFQSGTHVFEGTLSGTPAGTVSFLGQAIHIAPAGATINFGGTGLQWLAGTLGADASNTLINNGLLHITTGSTKIAGAGTLRNEGTIKYDAGNLYLGTGATLDNRGLLDFASEVDLYRTGGAPQLLSNSASATIRKSVGDAESGSSFIDVPLVNDGGTLDVVQGLLDLVEGGTHTDGTYLVAAGSTLRFSAGVHTFGGTLAGNPDGDVIFTGASISIAAGGSTIDFGGTGFQWHSGTIGSSAAGLLTNTGLLHATSGATKIAGAGTIRNNSTILYDEGNLYLGTDATIDNNGTFEFGSDVDLFRTGGAPQLLINRSSANVTKTNGAGLPSASSIDVPINNEGGVLSANVGVLELSEGGTYSGGTYSAADNARLEFKAGTHTFDGTLTGEPAGDIVFTGAVIRASENGAALAFSGTGFQWHTGTIGDDATTSLTNEALLHVTTGGTKILAAITLVNNADILYDQGNLYVGTNGVIDNVGLLEFGADVQLYRTGGAPQLVRNNPTAVILKSVGAPSQASSFIDVPVENANGTIRVDQGVLRLTEGGSLTDGRYIPASGTTLQLESNSFVVQGDFVEALDGDMVAVNTTLNVAASGARFDFTGSGLQWSSGTFGGQGTLVNVGEIRLVTGGSKYVTADSLRNDGVFQQLEGYLTFNGAAVRNNGEMTWDATGIALTQSTVTNAGTLAWDAGNILLNEGAIRNAGDWTQDGNLSISGTPAVVDGYGFENLAGGSFVKDGGLAYTNVSVPARNASGGTIGVTTGILRFRNVFDHEAGAVLEGTAWMDFAAAAFDNGGALQPGTSPGQLTYVGTYAPSDGAMLGIELGGTVPSSEHDQLAVRRTDYLVNNRFVGGDAVLGGDLNISLVDGFLPQPGDSFEILRAGEGVSGGFVTRSGLVQGDVALYPVYGDTTVTLVASSGVPTVSGSITVDPVSVVGGELREVSVAGSGFGPDVDVRLVCVECDNSTDDVRGRVGSISESALTVTFDLASDVNLGTYNLTVSDPRGGQATTPFFVSPGPPLVSVVATDGDLGEDGGNTGLFTISLNRALPQPLLVPIQFSGSATPFQDYVTDLVGTTIRIDAGSLVAPLAVFPLADEVAESDESVSVSILSSSDYEIGTGFASMTLKDGAAQAEFAVYAASPLRAGNLGLVTLTVYGQQIAEDAMVSLVGGGLTIDAVRTQTDTTGFAVASSFDLTDRPLGEYQIEITSGGETAALPSPFVIEPFRDGSVFVNLSLPPRVARGRRNRVSLTLFNTGNIDAVGIPSLEIPAGAEWHIDLPPSELPNGSLLEWDDTITPVETDRGLLLPLMPVRIPPGSSYVIPLHITLPSTGTATFRPYWIGS